MKSEKSVNSINSIHLNVNIGKGNEYSYPSSPYVQVKSKHKWLYIFSAIKFSFNMLIIHV
jgi:hypothetical protein